MSKLKRYSLYAATFLIAFSVTKYFASNSTDLTKNSVMIVNKAMNHGGTGIVYESSSKGSLVLTNDHVCGVLKNGGGLVVAGNTQYQVESYLESKVSDLCLVYIPSNLKQSTKLASYYPKLFSNAKVSGHPALMPTVISTGHFSERKIIQVFIGMKPCTAEESTSPDTEAICAFFNGLPIIKSYDAQLVTATIMPGSSGSGVYNENNELSGVVFAGQGDFGYAWTVNYDELKKFLNVESFNNPFTLIDQTVSLLNQKDEGKNIRDVIKKCSQATDPIIVEKCQAIYKDETWVK